MSNRRRNLWGLGALDGAIRVAVFILACVSTQTALFQAHMMLWCLLFILMILCLVALYCHLAKLSDRRPGRLYLISQLIFVGILCAVTLVLMVCSPRMDHSKTTFVLFLFALIMVWGYFIVLEALRLLCCLAFMICSYLKKKATPQQP